MDTGITAIAADTGMVIAADMATTDIAVDTGIAEVMVIAATTRAVLTVDESVGAGSTVVAVHPTWAATEVWAATAMEMVRLASITVAGTAALVVAGHAPVAASAGVADVPVVASAVVAHVPVAEALVAAAA